MLDFTSALYLGLRHSSASLGAWEALTLGRPSAVREPPDADAVAAELAHLQGCDAATLLPSTLHLFWDLFGVLARRKVVIYCDAGGYPIARWGTERARAMGASVLTFPHHDAAALEQLVRGASHRNLKPVVVTDGYCPRCGESAPLRAYADIARRGGGHLVVDDTQALGILGETPSHDRPYGKGGGGSLRWHRTFGPHVVIGTSLAKGFGVPLAVLAGERTLIERFRRDSDTRVHCSPPSVAVIRAARRALHANQAHGEALRRRLVQLVVRLREPLIQAGLETVGRLPFPVQTFLSTRRPPALLHEELLRTGIVGLLTTTCQPQAAGLTLVVTARHRFAEIERAGRIIVRAVHKNATPFDRHFTRARTEHAAGRTSGPTREQRGHHERQVHLPA